MQTKQHITLEVQKGDFTFTFHMPNGASWGNAIDASFDFLQHITELAKKASQPLRSSEECIHEEIT